MKGYLLFILFILSMPGLAQVGINTDNPRQALHIAGTTGTLRVESLNAANNIHNGGDVNGDLDLTNDTFPLYVDENGEFTLELQVINPSDDIDAFDDSALPTSTLYLSPTDADGEVTSILKTFTITVNREAILEVKYGISFDVYGGPLKTNITDLLARRIQNHITVTGDTRIYGASSKSYTSGSTASQVGNLFNAYSTYIKLPAAGTYDINFIGMVSSNVTSDITSTTSISTYVEFATGRDFLFMRLH
ncbi:MAG: hypothetical protein ABJM06_01585 [Gilvibacter sp.]